MSMPNSRVRPYTNPPSEPGNKKLVHAKETAGLAIIKPAKAAQTHRLNVETIITLLL
jgi:hypothetical protein